MGALGFLDVRSDLFDLLSYVLNIGDRVLLVLPFCLHFLELLAHVGQLLLYLGKMLGGKLVALLFQRGFLDLVLHYPP